jgi:DNA end-binding protein Ku
VDLVEIDPIFYDHAYYLAPGPGGAKPYRLLLDAMRESGKVGIARVVLRSKEQLVAIRPMDEVLAMTTMNFADEVVSTDHLDELPGDEVKTTKRELEIAKQLVDSLAGPFEPDKYHDTYREAVLNMIERKAQGEEIAVQPPTEERVTEAPDLMSALKASLEEVRTRGGGTPARGEGASAHAGAAPRKRRRSPASSSGGSTNGAASNGAGSTKAKAKPKASAGGGRGARTRKR